MMDALTLVRSEGGAAMTDEAYRHERQGLRARLSDWTGGARDMTRAALKEAMNWDAYKWTVLALLTATFLLEGGGQKGKHGPFDRHLPSGRALLRRHQGRA